MLAFYLERALRAAGVPIVGVAIGDDADRSTWRVGFDASATEADRQTAASVIAAFVPPTPADIFDEMAIREVDDKKLRAVARALWECIPNPTMTLAQMRQRAIAIYKTL